MPKARISEDIALRIALAARALPDFEAARLIAIIDDAIGLPPTAKKLAGLQLKDLRRARGGELAEMDEEPLKAAVAILRGEATVQAAAPPPVEPYVDGDMPGSIRVACASNGGEELDGHFGSARGFLVYQVSAADSRLIDVRVPDDAKAEDKNDNRARSIGDCHILYVASIGGPAAAKVVKAGVHPIKDPKGGSARERMAALQKVLGDKPPPWLAKIMGRTPEARARFEPVEHDA
jgi:nitrogen fixation protein NifX